MKKLLVNLLKHLPFLYYPLRKLYRSFRLWLISHRLKDFRIQFMVLSIGQACNYKCKYCGNFAPYAPSEFMRYKLEDIKLWLTQIIKSVDCIEKFQIQGGEPFVYSELGDLIKFMSNITELGGGILRKL